jgi:hypothetical protein
LSDQWDGKARKLTGATEKFLPACLFKFLAPYPGGSKFQELSCLSENVKKYAFRKQLSILRNWPISTRVGQINIS